MTDTHCHFELGDNAAEIIARAHLSGVTRIIAVGNDEALDKTAAASGLPYAATGLLGDQTLPVPRDMPVGGDPRGAPQVAIGEIALDENYARDTKPFLEKLELAKHLNLPVIIHTRGMDEATLACLREVPSRGVIHCFTGSVPFCRELLDLGFFISISGIVTFKKADNVREASLFVPEDRLLIETDSPYLAPVPMRGKRNEPGFLMHTAKFLADLRKVSLSHLEEITDQNATACFNLSPTVPNTPKGPSLT